MLYNILSITPRSLFLIMTKGTLPDVPYRDHPNYIFVPSKLLDCVLVNTGVGCPSEVVSNDRFGIRRNL
jgi:hypothetical protein